MQQEDKLSCLIKKAISLNVSCFDDLFCVGHMSFVWSNPWGKQSRGASDCEPSNCEVLCAGSAVRNHKILWSLSHGKSSWWWEWSTYKLHGEQYFIIISHLL